MKDTPQVVEESTLPVPAVSAEQAAKIAHAALAATAKPAEPSAKAEPSEIAKLGIKDAGDVLHVMEQGSQNIVNVCRSIAEKRVPQFKGSEEKVRDYLSGYRTRFPASGDTRARKSPTLNRPQRISKRK